MNRNGVQKTVLVQVIHYRWDNSFTAKAMREYPNTFMGVCRVNPEDPAAPDHLSYWTEEHSFRGVRLSPAEDESGDWFAGGLMDPLFSRAEELAVPMLILTRPSRLRNLADLLERHPTLDVVIDHMADCQPDDRHELELLLGMSRFQRVYVKISHTWSISKEEYPWRDTYELVKPVSVDGNFIVTGPRRQ